MENEDLVFSIVPPDDMKTRRRVTSIRQELYVDRAKFPLNKSKLEVLADLDVDNDPPRTQLWIGRVHDEVVVSARLNVCRSQSEFVAEMTITPEQEEQLLWRNEFPIMAIGRAVNLIKGPAYLAMRYHFLRYLWGCYEQGMVIHAQAAKNFGGQSFLRHLAKYGYQTSVWPGSGYYLGTEADQYYMSVIWLEWIPYGLFLIEEESIKGLSPAPGERPKEGAAPRPFSLGRWEGPWPSPLDGEGPLPSRNWEEEFAKIAADERQRKVIEARRSVGHALGLARPRTDRPPPKR